MTYNNLCILGAVTLIQNSVLSDIRSGGCEMIDHMYPDQMFQICTQVNGRYMNTEWYHIKSSVTDITFSVYYVVWTKIQSVVL